MYDDRIEILNPGALYGINRLEKLGTSTVMEARNPNIVRILEEKGSVIENRHSGIPTMNYEMKKYNLPAPEFYEERGSFKVIFRNQPFHDRKNDSGQQSGQQKKVIDQYKSMLLNYCIEPKTAKEIREYLKVKSRQYISSNIIQPLIQEEQLEYTNKCSINARNQKYVTVKKKNENSDN